MSCCAEEILVHYVLTFIAEGGQYHLRDGGRTAGGLGSCAPLPGQHTQPPAFLSLNSIGTSAIIGTANARANQWVSPAEPSPPLVTKQGPSTPVFHVCSSLSNIIFLAQYLKVTLF